MKILVLALCLSANLFSAEDEKAKKITQKDAENIAKMVTAPLPQIVSKVNNAVQSSIQALQASEWAFWDLLSAAEKKMKAGEKKPEPDKNILETYNRLMMRCNTGDLLWKGFNSHKSRRYPGDGDFKTLTDKTTAEFAKYLSSMKPGQYPTQKRHKTAIAKILETARKKMVFNLPYGPDGSDPEPTAPTAGESSYIQKSEKNKQDGKYAAPSWPDS